jgi:hypothetical protein
MDHPAHLQKSGLRERTARRGGVGQVDGELFYFRNDKAGVGPCATSAGCALDCTGQWPGNASNGCMESLGRRSVIITSVLSIFKTLNGV